jgi:hypothetical protein
MIDGLSVLELCLVSDAYGLLLGCYLNVIGRFACPDHLESCATARRRCAAGRVTHARQVEGRGQIKGNWHPHLKNQVVLGRTDYLLSFDMWTTQKMRPLIIHFHGNIFTELLPSNDRGLSLSLSLSLL